MGHMSAKLAVIIMTGTIDVRPACSEANRRAARHGRRKAEMISRHEKRKAGCVKHDVPSIPKRRARRATNRPNNRFDASARNIDSYLVSMARAPRQSER